jgi:methylaspartate mutase epsilon subunit
MPPSISITLVLLEALLAVANGVRCVSLAYPQGGHAWQDIAALRSMHLLARRYISNDNVVIHPVLHQFMGVFPGDPGRAEALITAGGIVGALGGARKVITKSPAEAIGIPDATANARGITLTKAAIDVALTELRVDEEAVREEQEWIEREVVELIEPVLSHRDLSAAIVSAFDEGTLDCPFSASVHARSLPAPARDSSGAIRLADPGRLSLSGHSRTANASRLKGRADSSTIIADINHFSRADAADPLAWWY